MDGVKLPDLIYKSICQDILRIAVKLLYMIHKIRIFIYCISDTYIFGIELANYISTLTRSENSRKNISIQVMIKI